MLKNTPNLKNGCTHFMRDTWNEGEQKSLCIYIDIKFICSSLRAILKFVILCYT